MKKNYLYYKAINWNVIEDELDNTTWERATSLFWLDIRIPIENDVKHWDNLKEDEKELLNKSLILLTNLSTFQSINVSEVIRNSARSQQEVAIFNNIQFTEMVNTKAYNKILRTFNRNDLLVDELFRWVDSDSEVRKRLEIIDEVYKSKDPLRKRFYAVCVEGILVYSQLSNLLIMWKKNKLFNLGEIVRMIILNESLHCIYLIHKINLLLKVVDEVEAETFRTWAKLQTIKLVTNEEQMIKSIYKDSYYKDISINLVRQEANSILSGIGLEPFFEVDQSILENLSKILNEIKRHDLTPQNLKQTLGEVKMSDKDYDF